MHKFELNTTSMTWEKEYIKSYTGCVRKIDLTQLERYARGNESIHKLQARTKKSLRHLEQIIHSVWNWKTVQIEFNTPRIAEETKHIQY